MNKKICIVVDHPGRDLAGYLNLINRLNNKNFLFYLVPFYNFREIYLIKPDAVILNHSRWIFKNFIKTLNELNISIFVLDTEGGMITKDLIKEYFIFSGIKKNINVVDGYFVWSRNIKKNLILHYNKINKKKLFVTGNPRFNFILSQRKKKLGTNVLINLNFATINPRYASFESEKKLLIKQGKNKNWIDKYCDHQSKMRKKFIMLAGELARSKFINKIIIRPHPYENSSEYKELFYKFKKITISQDEKLTDEINKSFVVIQNNCATSVDSALLGRKSIFFQPFKSKYLDQNFFLKISIVCKTPLEVISKIKYLKKIKKFELENQLEKINNHFSYIKNDYKKFNNILKKKTNKINSQKNLLFLLFKNNELTFFFKTLLKIFFGKNISFFYNKNYRQKIITIKNIINIIKTSNKIDKFLLIKNIKKIKFLNFNLYTIKIKK